MGRRPKTLIEQIAALDEEILELTVQQIGSKYEVFAALHVQIMDKQRQRRELEAPRKGNHENPSHTRTTD